MSALMSEQTLEQIRAEARELDPARVALTLLAAPFYALGFLVCMLAKALWVVVAFAWVASLTGWRKAGPPEIRRRPAELRSGYAPGARAR
jgi:hypothetical protein